MGIEEIIGMRLGMGIWMRKVWKDHRYENRDVKRNGNSHRDEHGG